MFTTCASIPERSFALFEVTSFLALAKFSVACISLFVASTTWLLALISSCALLIACCASSSCWFFKFPYNCSAFFKKLLLSPNNAIISEFPLVIMSDHVLSDTIPYSLNSSIAVSRTPIGPSNWLKASPRFSIALLLSSDVSANFNIWSVASITPS